MLLGCIISRKLDGKIIKGRIVETEAYDQTDAASHSYRGKTTRTEVMFGPAGRLYVYFTYGMHYCVNIVTGKEGEGSAVLIRAVEPLEGIEQMINNRSGKSSLELTNGPAKFAQAFEINKSFNGHDVRKWPIKLEQGERVPSGNIVITTRIGITKEIDKPWRFYLKDNPFVSRK